MKNLLLIVALLFALGTQAQTKVAQDRNTGNYYSVSSNYCCPNTSNLTGKCFIDSRGNAHPVINTGNKLYYKRTSVKTGKVYRVYLKVV